MVVHILCWNVAGWKRTAERIQESYQSLSTYFERHHADIVCLQEVKIPLLQLSSRSEPLGCSTIEGYESYWASCVDKDSCGFNGVATYVKKETVSTTSADATPLGIPELDQQGRCLLTRHGTVSIFNVYLPASGGHSVEFKMKFLRALSERMDVERSRGRNVILLGDLNIKHTALDVFWSDRVIYIDEILEQARNNNKDDSKVVVSKDNNNLAAAIASADAVASGNALKSATTTLPQSSWKQQVAEAWPKIVSVLKTMQVVPAQTTNTLTGERFDKFRLQVTTTTKLTTMTSTVNADKNNDKNRCVVYLGKHETCEEACRYSYDFSEWTYVDSETSQVHVAREANVVTVKVLAELMTKIAGITWSESTQRWIANTSGTVRRVDPPRQWMNRLLRKDHSSHGGTGAMVDTLRYFYPTAEHRFTCWSQHTNKRYTNEGVRLDYILVDASLVPHIQKGNVTSLRCGPARTDSAVVDRDNDKGVIDPLGQDGALCAATANGAFRPVSYHGEGIATASQKALDSQFGEPHTGIVYTPPSFSDHVAVSLLLSDGAVRCGDAHRNNCSASRTETDQAEAAATRKAQPHKSQRSIASFLTSSSACSRTTVSLTAAERLANLKSKITSKSSSSSKREFGIKSFLVPHVTSNSSSHSSSSQSGWARASSSSRAAKVQPSSKRPRLEQQQKQQYNNSTNSKSSANDRERKVKRNPTTTTTAMPTKKNTSILDHFRT